MIRSVATSIASFARSAPQSRVSLAHVLLLGCFLQASAQISFTRPTSNPLIARSTTVPSWHGFMSANPSAILFHGTVFLYARGIPAPKVPSTLGVWTAPSKAFNGLTWKKNPSPILEAGPPEAFDGKGIMDPAAVVFRDQVYLYYGGYAQGSRIGLATSLDGLHFTKQGEVFSHAGTPFPVVNRADGKLYLFYTRKTPAGTGWEYWVTTSADGLHFGPGQLVFSPSGEPGAFDQTSIITVRILYEAPFYYMTYGGSDPCPDYPSGIGLARSTDLLHWQRYPANPMLSRGPAGAWDEAALWSGAMLQVNGRYYLWYEATGTAAGPDTPASVKARDTCYGGYGRTSFSQVGVAIAPPDATLTSWPTDHPPAAPSAAPPRKPSQP